MKKLITAFCALVFIIPASAKTRYVVWRHDAPKGTEEWIKTNYYIWENTYSQAEMDDALELTPSGKGWIGGGYESVAPFDNARLAEGYELVFDIKSADKKELSVQLTSAAPEAAQSVKLDFPRDGEWHTIRLGVKERFPKVCKAWSQGAVGYVFSIVGGATSGESVCLRDIRYEPAR